MKVIINNVSYVPERLVLNDASVYDRALNAAMVHCNDFDDIKVVDWLRKLLSTLWFEGECFSGKRPFGNSDWKFDLICSLIECGYIPGTLTCDEDGCIEKQEYDELQADDLIYELIRYVFYREQKA